jgi:hypothetical protein
MNMQSKQRLPDAIAACAGLAGLALLGVVAASGDAIGQSVVALIGGGFAFGVLGCVGKEIVTARAEQRRGTRGVTSQPSHALRWPATVKMPPLADATASGFSESEQASFAPIVSLTEAQVERQRERQRADRRTTLNRA